MASYGGEPTTYLDRSTPDLRGDQVHFTAISGEAEIHVCMSRYEARCMAAEVIRLLDDDEIARRGALPLRRGRRKLPPGVH